jgi:hypothetical protein
MLETGGTIVNTFWLKIAGLAVVVVGVIFLISVIRGGKTQTESESPPKTFYDQAEEDKKRFLAEPQQVQEHEPVAHDKTPDEPPVEQVRPAEPTQLYFKPLSEIDSIEAERLLSVAVPGRSIGRLPMTGFKLMVDSCREIIRRWPDSWYAYRAMQMLADMPPRDRQRYNITQEEIDVSRFAKPRPGTELFNMRESR